MSAEGVKMKNNIAIKPIKYLQMLYKRYIFDGMSTVAKNFRIDSDLNDQATALLEGLGLSMSQAVSMFLRQVVLQRGLPFEVKYPEYPKGLREAVAEAERLEADPNTKRYTDMNEMWADLDK
jgi:DNA-damage-inducible protein J